MSKDIKIILGIVLLTVTIGMVGSATRGDCRSAALLFIPWGISIAIMVVKE